VKVIPETRRACCVVYLRFFVVFFSNHAIMANSLKTLNLF